MPFAPKKQPEISFIVSLYNRPEYLQSCLWSLKGQTFQDFEVIVTDNTEDDAVARRQQNIVESFGEQYRYVRTYGKIPVSDCYWSAEYGARLARGKWLCFPCEDCYYVPGFAEKMLAIAQRYDWDLVCSDVLYRWNSGQYGVLHVVPERSLATKTCFLVKRELFTGFRMKPQGKSAPCAADATAVLDVCKSGAEYGVVQEVLVVHN